MKLTRNIKAISKLLLILLLLGAIIIGGILSYLWVIASFINLRTPEKSVLAITNTTFNSQNTSYFDVTILNPSYSPDASITQIATSTEDGVLHNVTRTDPPLPYRLPEAEERTFRCIWDWADYTGENVRIIASVADGSGSTFEGETPLVNLKIIAPFFNSTVSVTHFNMTVQNGPESVTYVNITGITVDAEEVTPLVPQVFPSLNPSDSVPFMFSWEWTDYQGKDVTITVKTLQGYVARARTTLPSPVVLTITDVLFEVTNTTRFNITVQYSEGFPQYVNVTRITATLENGTPEDITKSVPLLPYTLYRNDSVTFTCDWNWTDHREKNVTITVYTLQDFTTFFTKATEARVILTITSVLFNATDTTHFNVTVRNSEFSLEEFVNVTRITVTVERGTPENVTVVPPPSLPYTLYVNKSVTFNCTWNWANYWNEGVSITVHTLQGYSANRTKVTPSPVIISETLFNISDTTHFNVTVRNSEFSPTYVLVTGITVTLENGTVQDVTVVAPTRLPYVLHPSDLVTFKCLWNWTGYRGKNATIAVYTLQGYTAYYTKATPDPVILIITSFYFDTANTTYFNITVRNSEYSLTQVNITRITVTFENETSLEVTVEPPPSLPYPLPPDDTITFKCSWIWTNYQGENVIITVETLEGYKASNPYTIPTIP